MGLLNYYKEKYMNGYVKSEMLQNCSYCGKMGTKFYICRFGEAEVEYFCNYDCLKKEKEIYLLFLKIDNLRFEKFEQRIK